MLVFITGVSGVGKSTIIECLVESFDWKVVPTYTTRVLRENESYKISISIEHFKALKNDGYFIDTNFFYGASYGTPKNKIIEAIEDKNQIWALDFPIHKINQVFKDYSFNCIVIQPTSENRLISRLKKCGRSERTSEALADFRINYLNVSERFDNFKEIFNQEDCVADVAQSINSYILERLLSKKLV